ncbi:uncharacterized protein LOC107761925 isoform X1 [Nicotiana tabacum]|uniref:Uncharacterized protein LOC107761925 isoform X1 n=1 Tax=Nicotiana tabacum TaxID=4097 RepID=A0AC58TCF0_TOBAC
MDYTKNSISSLAVFSLLLAAFIYISTNLSPFSPKSFFSFQKINPTHYFSPEMAKNELEEALNNASMEEKTVIITIINKAYVEPYKGEYPSMFDLFLEGFWEGEMTRPLLDHLLVVAMDQTAYERCKFRRLHCYRLLTDGVDFAGEKIYMSEEFNKMMWRRTQFLMDVLKLGYNFIFTGGLKGEERSVIALATLLGSCRFELILDLVGFYNIRLRFLCSLFVLFDWYFVLLFASCLCVYSFSFMCYYFITVIIYITRSILSAISLVVRGAYMNSLLSHPYFRRGAVRRMEWVESLSSHHRPYAPLKCLFSKPQM